MKKQLKIVHVIGQLGIGGAERQLHELIVHSDPEQFTHQVIYYDDSNDEEGIKLFRQSGITIHRLHRNRLNPLGFVLSLRKLIQNTAPDIVHCWLYSANLYGRWAAILSGCKSIIVAYRSSSLLRSGLLRINEWFTGHRVHYLANSKACAKEISSKLRVDYKKFSVIYNGVDLNKIKEAPPIPGFQDSISPDSHCKLVCMVGRLTEAKNYPMLLRTAALCKKNGLETRFGIAGHGEKEEELKTQAKELGVEERVFFLGLRKDVANLLNSCDLFLYTSMWEGFPNTLLEAMAAGLPIVTTGFKGADELIQHEKNGLIVPMDNDQGAYEALKYLLENPNRAAEFGQAAQLYARENFSIKNMVENTAQLYHTRCNRF